MGRENMRKISIFCFISFIFCLIMIISIYLFIPPIHKTTHSEMIKYKKELNVIKEPVKEAEQVPKLFYQYLNEKNYDEAIKLLGPSIAFYGNPSSRKYLDNLKQTTLIEFIDISNSGKFGISRVQDDYYAIKAYYAKINIDVKDPKLVPSIIGINYRLLIVVKETEDSPWLLDSDEYISPLD